MSSNGNVRSRAWLCLHQPRLRRDDMECTIGAARQRRSLKSKRPACITHAGPFTRQCWSGLLLLVARLESSAENVAERGPRVGRAVLRDRLLLLGHFQRFDGDGDLASAAVELDDARVDLLADREALGTLVATVAGELVALDEGGEVGSGDLDLDPAILDLEHLAGDDRTFPQIALAALVADLLGGERVAGELLDADSDALLLDVEHLGAQLVAFLVVLDRLLAWARPVEVGEMDHAVDVAVEADEEAELGLVLDLAFHH